MPVKQTEYRTGRHTVYKLTAHLVFVTKYRRGAINYAVLETITTTCHQVAHRHGFTILEINGEDDHIHLLIDYPPKKSITTLVMALKTNTSREVREKHAHHIKQYLWGNHFWSPSYFVTSTGGAPLDTIKNYIENQRQPPKTPGNPQKTKTNR